MILDVGKDQNLRVGEFCQQPANVVLYYINITQEEEQNLAT